MAWFSRRTNMREQFTPEQIKKWKPKRIANNTYKYFPDDNEEVLYVIKHQSTDILFFLPGGRVRIETDGWRTHTTKERINRFIPGRLYSDKGEWYIAGVPFFEGFIYPDDVERPTKASFEAILETKNMRKIRDFVKRLNPSIVGAWE